MTKRTNSSTRLAFNEATNKKRKGDNQPEETLIEDELFDLEQATGQGKGLSQMLNHLQEIMDGTEIDKIKSLNGELGHIQSIRLIDFMCHEDFHLELGPRINFIQGANGSGKSAILNGILLGLGGRASVTNRGVGLASFIRTNQNRARVILKLCNYIEGDDESEPYKPDTFGKSIIIERTVYANGTSSYKIRSENNKVVTEKKEEVDNIIKHFQILIDNPIAILTQEVSKNFLNSKSPADKYKFFVKATQLETIKNDYDQAEQFRDNALLAFNEKKETVRLMEKDLDKWMNQLKVIEIVNDSVGKLDSLNKEAVFSYINVTKKEIEGVQKQLDLEKTRFQKFIKQYEKLTEQSDNLKKKRDEVKDKLTEMEANSLQAGQDCEQTQVNLDLTKKNLDSKRIEVRKLESEVKKLTSEIGHLKTQVDRIERSEGIDYEAMITELQNAIQNEQDKLNSFSADNTNLQNDIQQLDQTIFQYKAEIRHFETRLQDYSKELEQLQHSRRNRIERYGSKFPELLKQIEVAYKGGKFRKRPIGPIGEYLNIEDNDVILAVEAFLGGFLYSFVVDNSNDQKVLLSITDHLFADSRQPDIIVRRFKERHDVSASEARHPKYRNFLQIINPKDSNVANVLIDHLSIETVLYIPDYEEAQSLLIKAETVPLNCSCAFTTDGDQMFPQSENSDYKCYPSKNTGGARLLVKDMQQVINNIYKVIQDLKREKVSYDDMLKQSEHDKTQKQKQSSELNRHISDVRKILFKKQNDLQELKDKSNNKPAEVHVYKEEISRLTNEINEMKSQLEVLNVEKEELSSKYNKAEKSMQRLAHDQNEFEKLREPYHLKMVGYGHQITEIEKKLETFQPEKNQYMAEQEELEKKINSLKARHDLELQKALQMNDGKVIETKRSPQDIQEEKEHVQVVIQENKGVLDPSKQAEIREAYLDLKTKVDNLRFDKKVLDKHMNDMSSALAARRMAFIQLRYYVHMTTNFVFEHVLAQKGFSGEIMINYNDEPPGSRRNNDSGKTLELLIRPRDEKQFQSNDGSYQRIVYSSTKSLSGGERSFSTVAFIISLWEICPSPFKILDEIDVFMDFVTRKISLDTLIEFASTRSTKQFIFLTPLRLQDSQKVDYMKVFQMPDVNSN